MNALTRVPVGPMSIERFRTVLDAQGFADLELLAAHARELLSGRVIWCISSTATGGGVAEMLHSLLAYTRGAGVDTHWKVLRGTPEFFAITKRLHNRLHDSPGDHGPLGARERATYDAVCERGAAALVEIARPDDIVLLHDPQTAGLAPHLADAGIRNLVWRAHVGVDEPSDQVREAWDFLRDDVTVAETFVFSRQRFVWEGLDPDRVKVIPPSIDVFSPKNQALAPDAIDAILGVAGLVRGGDPAKAVFERADGTPGRVDRHARMVEEQPVEAGTPIVTQVSRWDRLKDPIGVLRGFVAHAECAGAHLILAGPDTRGVADDPEGAEVLAEVTEAWRALPQAARARVHLASLPMADVEENAAMVNALQSRAAVVVQKSLAEGFGLTAAEALWKARPTVVSGVGGLQDQVVDEVTGLLVDPHELGRFGHAICRLLEDPPLAERLGTAGREHVRENFLEPRHLAQWVDVIESLSRTAR